MRRGQHFAPPLMASYKLPTPEAKPHRDLRDYFVVLILGIAASLWFTHVLTHSITKQMINETGDPNVTLFFLKWWIWAPLHGTNPFLFSSISWPVSYNTAWLTSLPGPAILMTPITLLFGVIATWNLLIFTAPILASLSAAALLRTLNIRHLPAIISSLTFGYSSYELSELLGHLFLVLVFPIPLLYALIIRYLKRDCSRRFFLFWAIVLLSFILYTSIEMAFSLALVSLGFVVCLFIGAPKETVAVIKNEVGEILTVILGTFAVASPLIYYVFRGISASKSISNSVTAYSINLANLIIPTVIDFFQTSSSRTIASRFSGNVSEQGGYIGLLLALLLLIVLLKGSIRSRLSRTMVLGTLLLLLATLGPRLHVAGVASHLKLPWTLLSHLPLTSNALPSRFMVYVALALSVWLGLLVRWCRHAYERRTYIVLMSLGLLLLLPSPTLNSWSTPFLPAVVTNGQLATSTGGGGSLLVGAGVSSGPTSNISSVWSEASGYKLSFTQAPWGYDPYRDIDYFNSWPLVTLLDLKDPPAIPRQLIVDFAAAHLDRTIDVLPGNRAWVTLLTSMGFPSKEVGPIWIFRMPQLPASSVSRGSIGNTLVSFYQSEVHVLEAAARCFVVKTGSAGGLDPQAAIQEGCLSRSYASATPGSNWTAGNAWLGPQVGGAAVGVGVTGDLAKSIFSGVSGFQSYVYYSPSAHNVDIKTMSGKPFGTYLGVL